MRDALGWRATYLDRLRKGKPIIVHGDGQSLWCACHAEDVACAFVNAAARRELEFRYTIPWAEGAKRLADWLAAHGRIANSDDPTEGAIRDDALIAAWEQACATMQGFMIDD